MNNERQTDGAFFYISGGVLDVVDAPTKNSRAPRALLHVERVTRGRDGAQSSQQYQIVCSGDIAHAAFALSPRQSVCVSGRMFGVRNERGFYNIALYAEGLEQRFSAPARPQESPAARAAANMRHDRAASGYASPPPPPAANVPPAPAPDQYQGAPFNADAPPPPPSDEADADIPF